MTHLCCRIMWQLRYFDIPQMYFRQNLLLFRIIFPELLYQTRIVDLIWIVVISDLNFTKLLQSRKLILNFSLLMFGLLCKHSTAFHKVMEITLLVMYLFNQTMLMCFLHQVWNLAFFVRIERQLFMLNYLLLIGHIFQSVVT